MAQPDPEPAAAWPEGGPARISPPPPPSPPPPAPSAGPPPGSVSDVVTGLIHHLEFWVPDLDRAVASWGWLLDELGYKPFGD